MTDLTREQIETMRLGMKRNGWFHKDDRDALCRMALAYLDATEWRPIETAPKQCDPSILVADIRTGDVWSDWWDENNECWYACGDTGLTAPTHWLPLPQPPKEKGGKP